MHNDNHSQNQRRSSDRPSSDGHRGARSGGPGGNGCRGRDDRGPRKDHGGRGGDRSRDDRGPRKDFGSRDGQGGRNGKPGGFRKGGKPGGYQGGKSGGYRKDDRGPRGGKSFERKRGEGDRSQGDGDERRDFRGPRKDFRDCGDGPRGPRRDFSDRRESGPRDDREPRKDFHPRDDQPRGPRRDSRGSGHPREVFVDGKLMAAPDQGDGRDRGRGRDFGGRGDRPRDGRPPRRDDGARAKRPNSHHATSARELALSALHQLRERDAFAQDIIAKTIDKSRLSREDRAFATRLVLGVTSTRGTLEDVIDGCMDSPDDAAPAVRDALALSAYEIIFLQKSPHAAVDQGVELVKTVAPRAGGLANAVLRRVVRAREHFPFGDPRTDIAAYARLHGFPVWLAERLIAELGPEGARDFMVASNEPAPVFVSVNAVKASEDEVVSVLAAAHGDPTPVTVAGRPVPGCYRVSSGVPLLDGRVRRMFSQGLLLVSDATSQAVASLVVGDEAPASFLEIGAGRATKTILDQSCAYRRFGRQISDYVTVDVHAFKTRLLQERAELYGVTVTEPIIGDATDLDALVGERTFDCVFIDAPCSGLGTLRRHADIRWRLRPETIDESADLDAHLLASAAAHVAPGGILAYATCTITHEENADAVDQFLATELGSAFEVIPYENPELGVERPFFSIPLEPGGPDAHFLALLRKKA